MYTSTASVPVIYEKLIIQKTTGYTVVGIKFLVGTGHGDVT